MTATAILSLKPCATCGVIDRSPDGQCRPCKQKKNKAYYEANREKANASSRNWKLNNPERLRETGEKYKLTNKEAIAASQRAWVVRNRLHLRLKEHKRRAKLKAGGVLSKDIVSRLMKLQRGLCPCCKEKLGDDFHVDHITPIARGGSNDDSNVQLLRRTCNHKKNAKHPIDFMQERGFLL